MKKEIKLPSYGTQENDRRAKKFKSSLRRRVSRRREEKAIEALIALALHPVSSKAPTDAEIEKWLTECRAGLHKVSKEGKRALDKAGRKFLLELKEHMGKTGNTIYGEPANDQADRQQPDPAIG